MLREGLTDRLVPDHAYVQKAKAGKLLLAQKSRLLATADQASRDEQARQTRLLELQNPPVCPLPESGSQTTPEAPCAEPASPESTARQKELGALRSASKRFEKYRLEREKKIESLHLKLIDNQLEKEAMQKEVSRIDQLVTQEMVRLDTRNKTLMDAHGRAQNHRAQPLLPSLRAL